MIWKGIFDAWHAHGRYYGRVAFVRADNEPSAREALQVAALAEFPNHKIELIGIGVSTQSAADAFDLKKAQTVEWMIRQRERQVLLCPMCNGTGRA